MADTSALSEGAIDLIFNDINTAEKLFPVPVMQCLQVKQISSNGQAEERYRLVLNDGQHYIQSVLGTSHSYLAREERLVRGCFVRIKRYQPNSLKGKSILVVLDLEIIDEMGIQEKVGTPVGFVDAKPEGDTAMTGGEFYGAKKEEETTQPKQALAARPAMHGGANIALIDSLSPYAPKWTIKARVTVKSDIKTWHKASGEGKLFSVNLLDESGEIKATGFNDQCDAFYDVFQEGSVYYISSPCRIQMAKKQFTNLKHEYEITFERDTVVEKAEDQSSVPQMQFNFCSLQELNGVEKDNTVDVIGVLKKVEDVATINSKKDQRPFQKRELTIVDDTGFEIRVTIWGKTATNFDAQPESVIAFKGTKVSDFGGKSLSLLSSGTMSIDPDIPDAHRLKGWYDSAGRTESFATHQNLASMAGATGRKDEAKTILQVKEENLGVDDQAYYSVKATIGYVKQENFCYPACSSPDCNKKVVQLGDGQWQCERCNVAHEKPNYRFILSINVNDHTGQQWLSAFDEPATVIMGMTANELMAIKEDDEQQFMQKCGTPIGTKLHFRCRAKMDNFGEAQRVRYQVMRASPLDFVAEGKELQALIDQYNAL